MNRIMAFLRVISQTGGPQPEKLPVNPKPKNVHEAFSEVFNWGDVPAVKDLKSKLDTLVLNIQLSPSSDLLKQVYTLYRDTILIGRDVQGKEAQNQWGVVEPEFFAKMESERIETAKLQITEANIQLEKLSKLDPEAVEFLLTNFDSIVATYQEPIKLVECRYTDSSPYDSGIFVKTVIDYLDSGLGVGRCAYVVALEEEHRHFYETYIGDSAADV